MQSVTVTKKRNLAMELNELVADFFCILFSFSFINHFKWLFGRESGHLCFVTKGLSAQEMT